jgi:hypothetical protein
VQSAQLWRSIDPTRFNDGVLYLPAMVEIQPKEPDWGVADFADLHRRVDDDRPHGGDEDSGKLLCLKCMAIKVRNREPASPVWMYFAQRQGRRLFCHMGTHHVHPEHEPESDEHKALVEREVRSCERVGASVDTEVRTANGRRRADFIAVGPTVTLAGEVQRSTESPRRIAQRQRDLTRDGKRALWTTDSRRPEFLAGVPRLVIPNLTSWQQALRDPELAIVAGLTLVEYQRCGWTDEWTGSIRCPKTRLLRTCGKIHAYPTANATPNTYKPTSGPVAQFGMGNRPHLDYVVAGIVLAQWLPYQRTARGARQFVWMPAEDYIRFVDDRGGTDPAIAERSVGIASGRGQASARTCETDAEAAPAPSVIDLKPHAPVPGGVVLNWANHSVGSPAPCRHCGRPALCRDEGGIPAHKVCVEAAIAAGQQ